MERKKKKITKLSNVWVVRVVWVVSVGLVHKIGQTGFENGELQINECKLSPEHKAKMNIYFIIYAIQ